MRDFWVSASIGTYYLTIRTRGLIRLQPWCQTLSSSHRNRKMYVAVAIILLLVGQWLVGV